MFFPGRDEALSHTIKAETAISDLYAEAIRRWAPDVQAAVLPSLTASAAGEQLPPDPDAVAQQQPSWETAATAVIVAGLAVLWAVAVYETLSGLAGVVPSIGGDGGDERPPVPEIDDAVIDIISASVRQSRAEVNDAVAYVQATPSLAAARDDFLSSKREDIFTSTPKAVRAKVTAAISDPVLTVSVIPEDRPAVLQAEAAKVLQPSSAVMREIARGGGYQAAGVMNHAVVAAAVASARESGEELEKTWICTIDGKTRPTHWAADGQRVPLAGRFSVGADQLFVPGDPAGSPAEVKNCRCRVGILAVDEEIPDEVDRHTERLNGRDSVQVNRQGSQADEIRRRADSGNVRARDDPNGIGQVASGGWAAPSEQEYDMTTPVIGGPTKAELSAFAADGGDTTDSETYLTFTDALFAVTGTPTDDRRMLAADIALSMRDTPMPLQWCEKMEGGHYGSVTVGVIESIDFKNGQVLASGYMLNNENALKAMDLVAHGVCNPSVDLANATATWTYEDGTIVTDENYDPELPIYETVTEATLTAATIVAIPAFGQTRIALNAERESRDTALVASAAAKFQPRVYDPALFSDPKLPGPTMLTMNPQTGRIYGHIADFKEKHRSVGLGHISPPHSQTGYAHFHTSPPVHLSDGSRLPVGRLTVGIGHAPTSGISNAEAQAHYDNTEACFALVRAGEDAHGIWVSGVAAPWATPEKIEMGLAAPLSGDWRPYGGALELVAALAVNTPGFLCRATTDSRGNPLSLVASMSPRPGAPARPVLSREDIKAAVAEALADSQRAAELAQRRDAVLARAFAAVGDPPAELTPTERIGQMLAGRA
ncbi:hypothetical protein BTO20_06010 [Mycobacterium dioxanotrophicus]|jgi:hypothetical protein|uniref:Phage head morphogenesis domain-containing protein n=1 Tax=Mycobacterium dioxanotrophicus TaxID=482462 RepID=A0A1Y0BZA2_9MYCO|nr:hypothetical protein [Mycobacterium dioxanotrophicus]ART68196.1 hypothetical protein BTO20_06010 [Mycobacterium dioxanotrophicus]